VEAPPVATRTGRLAAAVGVILGAHLGMVALGFVGALAWLPFMRQTGGGLDWLIGMFFGALLGVPVGGALGCGLALRVRNHAGAWRSAKVAGLLLLVGLLPFGALWVTADQEPEWSGWLFVLALEIPIIAVALLIRRLSGDRR
jgi:hypothetical protein